MFDNILLPIDIHHPESWNKALPLALEAIGKDGQLHILGIVHDLGSALVASYLPPDFEKKALQHMKNDLGEFAKKQVPDHAKVMTHVGHGHVSETILKAAKKVKADAIFMASHPPDELRTFLVGSHANKVVRHAPMPVMVIR
ncbi:universal stress protein [Litoreibacter roseus]|uniref:Universal stress protein UspA n=1 Tax=Litoreibacter roseus TaxID=2601869 RepID=A0A6N6JFI3_9RHOB|nr:universal stress protein [Litoreibacter roseus]GFE64905.1 universal stress protein UspA [Litoreibacter roseus]